MSSLYHMGEGIKGGVSSLLATSALQTLPLYICLLPNNLSTAGAKESESVRTHVRERERKEYEPQLLIPQQTEKEMPYMTMLFPLLFVSVVHGAKAEDRAG